MFIFTGKRILGKLPVLPKLLKNLELKEMEMDFFHFYDTGQRSMSLETICNHLKKFIEYHLGHFNVGFDSNESILKKLLGMWPRDKNAYIFINATEKIDSKHNIDSELYECARDNPSLHIVCSITISVSEWNANAKEFVLPPVTIDEKKVIIRSYLGKFGKPLSTKILIRSHPIMYWIRRCC